MDKSDAIKRLERLACKHATEGTYLAALDRLLSLGMNAEQAVEMLEGLYLAAADDYGD